MPRGQQHNTLLYSTLLYYTLLYNAGGKGQMPWPRLETADLPKSEAKAVCCSIGLQSQGKPRLKLLQEPECIYLYVYIYIYVSMYVYVDIDIICVYLRTGTNQRDPSKATVVLPCLRLRSQRPPELLQEVSSSELRDPDQSPIREVRKQPSGFQGPCGVNDWFIFEPLPRPSNCLPNQP